MAALHTARVKLQCNLNSLTENGDLNTTFLEKIKSSQTLLSPIAEIPSQPGKQEKHNLDKQTNINSDEQCNKTKREDGDDSNPSSRPGEYQHRLFTHAGHAENMLLLFSALAPSCLWPFTSLIF